MRLRTLILLAAPVAFTLACRASERRPVVLSAAAPISATTSVGMAPMFAVAPNGAEAAAWVSAPGGGTDGRLYVSMNDAVPAEIQDTLGPIDAHGESPPKLAFSGDGSLYALYNVSKPTPGERFPRTALRLVKSTDGGQSWAAPVTVTDDAVFGSHNFHSLHAAPDGSVYVGWLDGRAGKSAAYITRSADGGTTWSANQRIEMGEACPCCRTAMAADAKGNVFIAWRKVFPGDVRDVVVAHSPDHGTTWEAPVRVHADEWVFGGCPHAGPALQLDSAGTLHATWWTGKEGSAGVYYTRSTDGARTFAAPTPLGVAQFSRAAHVQLGLGTGGLVVAAWDDGTLKNPQVVMRVSHNGGTTFNEAVMVSEEGRSAGYPVLAVAGRRVSIAWSDESLESQAHEAAMMAEMNRTKAPKGPHAIGAKQVLVRRGEVE